MDKDEVLNEILIHLVNDRTPSEFMNKLKDEGLLSKYPFNFISDLQEVNQSKEHHPEGNVWIHTMMVIDKGASYLDEVTLKKEFMLGLLLHDIGKKTTTKIRKGRITSYDHDKVGEIMGNEFLESFSLSKDFKEKVIYFIRYHMHLLFIIKKLPYGNIEGMLKNEELLRDLSYIFLSDRLGRGNINKIKENEVIKEVEQFRKAYIKSEKKS